MDRREILRLLAAGTAWPLVDRLVPLELADLCREVHAAAQASGEGGRALDPQAMAVLAAACERIIPTDETPGAVAAGVPQFVDRMLADWYEADARDRFLRGLGELEARSREAHRRPFVECAAAEQDGLLMVLDDEVRILDVDDRSSHWFGLLKFLTVWGYCTSEIGMRQELRTYPLPMRYDGDAPYEPRRRSGD
jgi:gluconate 2-dehydrogenase gamma chain